MNLRQRHWLQGQTTTAHGSCCASHAGSTEMDDQFELGRLQNWQVRWFGALEDTGSIDTYLAECVEDISAVAHQATNFSRGRSR